MPIISATSRTYKLKVLKSCQTAFRKFDFAYFETIWYQAGLVVLTSVRVIPAKCFSRVLSSVRCLIVLESRPSFCARMKSPSCFDGNRIRMKRQCRDYWVGCTVERFFLSL